MNLRHASSLCSFVVVEAVDYEADDRAAEDAEDEYGRGGPITAKPITTPQIAPSNNLDIRSRLKNRIKM